jgi:hypothetical protein
MDYCSIYIRISGVGANSPIWGITNLGVKEENSSKWGKKTQ